MVKTRNAAKSDATSAKESTKETTKTTKSLASNPKISKSKKATVLTEEKSCRISGKTIPEITEATVSKGEEALDTQLKLVDSGTSRKQDVMVDVQETLKKASFPEVSSVSVPSSEKLPELNFGGSLPEVDVETGGASRAVVVEQGNSPVKSAVKRSEKMKAWRNKIHKSGYVKPPSAIRRKSMVQMVSPSKFSAKIIQFRGDKPQLKESVVEKVDKSVSENLASEQFGGEPVSDEGLSKKVIEEDDGKESTVPEEEGAEQIEEVEATASVEEDSLNDIFKDIDDVADELQKDGIGVKGTDALSSQINQETKDSLAAVVPEDRRGSDSPATSINPDEAIADIQRSVQTLPEPMMEHRDDEDLVKNVEQSEDSLDVVPLAQLKKDKAKKQVTFENPAKKTMSRKEVESKVTGGAESSKKRKRSVPVPASVQAGDRNVQTPDSEDAPAGIVKSGVWFVDKEAARKWKSVLQRKIIPEKVLDEDL